MISIDQHRELLRNAEEFNSELETLHRECSKDDAFDPVKSMLRDCRFSMANNVHRIQSTLQAREKLLMKKSAMLAKESAEEVPA